MTLHDPQNIAHAFRELAERAPDEEVILAEDLRLTRAKLALLIEAYARRMVREGVRQGDLVSINTSDPVITIACIFALSLVGAQYIQFSIDLLDAKEPNPRHFLRSIDVPPVENCDEIVLDNSWSPKFSKDDGQTVEFAGLPDRQATCWISPSTGTTGRPKFSAVSVELLYKRIAAIADDYGPGQTRLAMLFAPFSRPYVIRAVAALVFGHVIVDSRNVNFLRESNVNFICASPRQIRIWLGETKLEEKFPVVQVSGAKLPLDQVEALLCNFERVEDVYGSNETIKAHINVFKKQCDVLEVVGTPVPSPVEIVDEHGLPCPEGLSGTVRVSTNYLVDGYIGEPEATKNHFKDGCFLPGDRGLWKENNVLEILGREGDIVNIEGEKVLLSDVDDAISDAVGVDVASCFEDPAPEEGEGKLAACVVLKEGYNVAETVRSAWHIISRKMGLGIAPGSILVVPRLELTADGVAKRKFARDLFITTLTKAPPSYLAAHLYRFRIDYNA